MGCTESDLIEFTNALNNDNSQHQSPQINKQKNSNQPFSAQSNPNSQGINSQKPNYTQPQQQQSLNYSPYQPSGQPYNQPNQYFSQQPMQAAYGQQIQQQQVYSGSQQPAQNFQQGVVAQSKGQNSQLNAPNIEKDLKDKHNNLNQSKNQIFKRQQMSQYIQPNDTFAEHHLKHELTLTNFVDGNRIKRRQIVEHLIIQSAWSNVGFGNIIALTQSAQLAWMQRTFLDIWKIGHKEYFEDHIDVKKVRNKISEQYMFELYMLKEYVDSGFGNINFLLHDSRLNLFTIAQLSDDALYGVFKRLKAQYPQTGTKDDTVFPDVPNTTTKINLLDHFPCKAFSDPNNINVQTIYDDVRFLLKRASQQEADFKSDMKLILGDDVLACTKVGKTIENGVEQFNACAVRRVFIKWAQNMIEKCPELLKTNTFLNFVKSKVKICDNFFFKSTIQETTHKQVIDCLAELLQIAKYNPKTNQKNPNFIFNIYDLLRCKIKRSSAELIVQLLNKMQNTTVTASGKKFEVIRIKNRFKTNNKDLLINFRYGDVIIGEAQLCIDDSSASKITKMNYEFCHYIYQLERGLFGPTIELMMQYEDYSRPSTRVSFEAEGIVKKRLKQPDESIQIRQRKCFHGHSMIGLKRNIFGQGDSAASCNFCQRITNTAIPYDYCYQCTCFFCRVCQADYKKVDTKNIYMLCTEQKNILKIQSFKQLQGQCLKNGALIVLFYESDAQSTILKDTLVHYYNKILVLPNSNVPKFALVNYDDQQSKNLCTQMNIINFPTMIVFNRQAGIARTVVGCSWLQMGKLIETYNKLLKNQSIELEIRCASDCGEAMRVVQVDPENQLLICFSCFGSNNQNPTIPNQYKCYGLKCSQNHYRCLACGYAALSIPLTYLDFSGQKYLWTNPKQRVKPIRCFKNHNIQILKQNPSGNWENQCFSCSRKFVFDNNKGIGLCKTCQVYCCPRCFSTQEPLAKSMNNRSNDIGYHYVESTAEEATSCLCGRRFKKVYKSRELTLKEVFQNIHGNQINSWVCQLCSRKRKPGQMHLACFRCPVYSQLLNEKDEEGQQKFKNLEICYYCAQKSQIVLQIPQAKIIVDTFTPFFCYSNHPIVITSLPPADKSLTVNCQFCGKKYYSYTERYCCRTCNSNCCKNCVYKLVNKYPPKTKQKCADGQSLSLLYKSERLNFCEKCLIVIRKDHFNCKNCGYNLCMNCSQIQKPFIANSGQEFKRNAQRRQKQQSLIIKPTLDQRMQSHKNISQEPEFGWNNIEEFLDDLF